MEDVALIDECARVAEEFVRDIYYPSLDKSRTQLHKFYREDSVVIWDGTAFAGLASIAGLIEDLPLSSHTIKCFDAQPMPENAKLIIVTGTVSFADQPARDFHHQFVIAHDGNDFLLYQTVRLLS